MGAISDTLSGNGTGDYLVAFLILAAGLAAVSVFKKIFDTWLKKRLESGEMFISAVAAGFIEKHVFLTLYLAVVYVTLGSIYLHPKIERMVDVLALFVISFIAARVATDVLSAMMTAPREGGKGVPVISEVPRGVIPLIKVVVWGVVIVFLLDNLGFNITTLVAGFGIGGVAVALASQAVLGDLFSYFVILFDKPFTLGDFIIVGDKMGVVERVGIKTTRIRSLSGEELVFSNTALTNSQVHNYKKMARRRVVFKIGVTYQTPKEKVESVPPFIKSVIEAAEGATFDRSHFASYGDFALIFETVYYVETNDYAKYMDIQQGINLAIMERFQNEGIEFAYPTQTVYVVSAAAQPAATPASGETAG